MIFDFRLRPPYKSFRNLGIFSPACNEIAPQRLHAIPSEAARKKDLDLFWKEMEEAGISAGVIMGRRLPDDAASVDNSDILEMAREFPEKVVPFGSVDISGGISAALDELESCIEGGIRGMALEPAMSMPPRMADANVLYPVYARCEKACLPIVLTLSFFQGDLDYSNPATVQRIARDFPNLQIVVAHGCYPWVPMIYQLPLVNSNVWLLPDIYAYNPTAPGNEMFGNAMRWLNGDNMLFGSAYPCYNMAQAVHDIERFGFPETLREKFFHGNAEKLLALKPAAG